MSIATRHDQPSATHDGGNSSEETFILPLHINCSRCHHMHKHVRIPVHKNPQLITKFNCHNCHHQIVAIGRNETQSSFGSTETQPVEAGYARPSRPSNLQSCTNADQPNGRLSDVVEADPTVPSSPSGPLGPGPSLSPHEGSHNGCTGARSQGAGARNDGSLGGASGPTTQSLPKTRSRLILKLKQGKKHILKESKRMRLFVFGFWKREAPSASSCVQTRVGVVIPSDNQNFQPRPREGDRSAQSQDYDHSPTSPSEFERRPSSVEEQLQAKAQKNERLRQRRREATLKWNVLSRSVCHCEANFPSMARSSVSTDAGTDSPRTSRRFTLQQTVDAIAEVTPSNLLNFADGPRPLSHPIGPLEDIALDTPAEIGTRPHARLSQATTIRDGGEV